MTPDDIIAHRRRRLLELTDELGNVSEACRQMGISRTRYYEWRKIADQYGLEALTPKPRRRPQLANETPTHVVAELLTMAVAEPTIGARQYSDRLADRGQVVSKTTVQKILVDHGLGRRTQRLTNSGPRSGRQRAHPPGSGTSATVNNSSTAQYGSSSGRQSR